MMPTMNISDGSSDVLLSKADIPEIQSWVWLPNKPDDRDKLYNAELAEIYRQLPPEECDPALLHKLLGVVLHLPERRELIKAAEANGHHYGAHASAVAYNALRLAEHWPDRASVTSAFKLTAISGELLDAEDAVTQKRARSVETLKLAWRYFKPVAHIWLAIKLRRMQGVPWPETPVAWGDVLQLSEAIADLLLAIEHDRAHGPIFHNDWAVRIPVGLRERLDALRPDPFRVGWIAPISDAERAKIEARGEKVVVHRKGRKKRVR